MTEKENLKDNLKLIKEACEALLTAGNVLKKKDEHIDLIIEKAVYNYVHHNDKQGFLYAFFKCRLWLLVKDFFESQEISFRFDVKKDKLFIYGDKEQFKSLKSFLEYRGKVKEENKITRAQVSLRLKNNKPIFDLKKIKTIEEIETLIEHLRALKKTFKK